MWCGEDENKTAADKKRDEMCLQSVWSTKLRDLILKLPDQIAKFRGPNRL